MMNTPMNTGMMVEESFSGPLAITGGILMLLSVVMAVNYQVSCTEPEIITSPGLRETG